MSSRRRTSADRLHRSVCRSQLIVAWYSWSDLTSPFPLMAASMPSAAGRVGRGDGREVRHLVLDARLADAPEVLDRVRLHRRSVDDERDLAVLDDVEAVGASLADLRDGIRRDAEVAEPVGRALGREDREAEVHELLDGGLDVGLLLRERDEDAARLRRKRRARGLLRLEVRKAEVVRKTENLARGAHLRPEDGIHLRELVERQHRLLHAEVRDDVLLVEPHRLHGVAEHEVRRDAGHLNAADLGHERNRAACARVRLDDVHLVVLDRELHVHEPHDL